MNCRFHDKPACPTCNVGERYAPIVYSISPCTAGEMRKKLCLDGHDCWCLKNTKAFDSNGKVNDIGMAHYWLDKYLESERANRELRGKGMVGLRDTDDSRREPCPACDGSGLTKDDGPDCYACIGTGWVPVDSRRDPYPPDNRRRTWWCPICHEKSDDDGIVRDHKETCCHYGSALAPPATAADQRQENDDG